MPSAPTIAPPEPLQFSSEERDAIAETIEERYRKALEQRQSWNQNHTTYDAMWRGQVEDRAGPWPGASNLHVQMPYWLVDAVNTRLVNGIWGQVPLVGGMAEEDDDQEILRSAVKLVDWHLQPKRMNARALWTRISKMRCIHGFGVGLITYARDPYSYNRVIRTGPPSPVLNPDGTFQFNEKGEPVVRQETETELVQGIKYDGPVLYPLEWDDVVAPLDSMNLQPLRPSNPGGSDLVILRQYELLSQIWKKREAVYTYIQDDDELNDKDYWIDKAPSQDRSNQLGTGDNHQRSRLQIHAEGRQRDPSRRPPNHRPNPEFEVLTVFMPWEIEDAHGEVEERECVFFMTLHPREVIGGFLLSDINWKEDRPLLELHYQTVGTRLYSMGVMEIVRHLSAELDTIHNLRMDVGFATNMPFFFYRASSAFDPDKIVIRPLKGVPVDDVSDVAFPQLQNVTSFYAQEEQLLYTLVERVMGVTDLFLGMSPTHGAAARHATGFVGTQQESLARTSEILNSDADAISFLYRTIYNMEMQFGPEERILRLEGQTGPLAQVELTREELWFRGEYDFRLGANQGMYSSMLKQQQGQALMQLRGQSPLINQDPGRVWETENFFLHGIGITNPDLYIGPKEAVAQSSPQSQSEENGEMDQHKHGYNQPAPVHPSDNDAQHLEESQQHLASPGYQAMGRPNYAGHLQHMQQHVQQQQQKAQQQQMMQQQAMANMGQAPTGSAGQQPQQDRIVPQLMNVENMGAMGSVGQSPAMNATMPPPMMGGNGR